MTKQLLTSDDGWFIYLITKSLTFSPLSNTSLVLSIFLCSFLSLFLSSFFLPEKLNRFTYNCHNVELLKCVHWNIWLALMPYDLTFTLKIHIQIMVEKLTISVPYFFTWNHILRYILIPLGEIPNVQNYQEQEENFFKRIKCFYSFHHSGFLCTFTTCGAASWMSFCTIGTHLAWLAHRLRSSKRPTR